MSMCWQMTHKNVYQTFKKNKLVITFLKDKKATFINLGFHKSRNYDIIWFELQNTSASYPLWEQSLKNLSDKIQIACPDLRNALSLVPIDVLEVFSQEPSVLVRFVCGPLANGRPAYLSTCSPVLPEPRWQNAPQQLQAMRKCRPIRTKPHNFSNKAFVSQLSTATNNARDSELEK